jgi:hypothetical protein
VSRTLGLPTGSLGCSKEGNTLAEGPRHRFRICSLYSPQGEVAVDDLQVRGGLRGREAVGENNHEGKDDSGCSFESRHREW